MARDRENTFAFWAQSPSNSEQERCERVIRAIRTAISRSPKLQAKKTWLGKTSKHDWPIEMPCESKRMDTTHNTALEPAAQGPVADAPAAHRAR